MAVGFTAMMPLFQERSADLIKEKLADIYGESFPPHYLWTIRVSTGARLIIIHSRGSSFSTINTLHTSPKNLGGRKIVRFHY
jgi:hypothetical protein